MLLSVLFPQDIDLLLEENTYQQCLSLSNKRERELKALKVIFIFDFYRLYIKLHGLRSFPNFYTTLFYGHLLAVIHSEKRITILYRFFELKIDSYLSRLLKNELFPRFFIQIENSHSPRFYQFLFPSSKTRFNLSISRLIVTLEKVER